MLGLRYSGELPLQPVSLVLTAGATLWPGDPPYRAICPLTLPHFLMGTFQGPLGQVFPDASDGIIQLGAMNILFTNSQHLFARLYHSQSKKKYFPLFHWIVQNLHYYILTVFLDHDGWWESFLSGKGFAIYYLKRDACSIWMDLHGVQESELESHWQDLLKDCERSKGPVIWLCRWPGQSEVLGWKTGMVYVTGSPPLLPGRQVAEIKGSRILGTCYPL